MRKNLLCHPHHPRTITYFVKVLERMKTIGESGLKPDLHCLSAALDAAGGSGEWESALRVLDEMRASGIKPDAFVYRYVGPGPPWGCVCCRSLTSLSGKLRAQIQVGTYSVNVKPRKGL